MSQKKIGSVKKCFPQPVFTLFKVNNGNTRIICEICLRLKRRYQNNTGKAITFFGGTVDGWNKIFTQIFLQEDLGQIV